MVVVLHHLTIMGRTIYEDFPNQAGFIQVLGYRDVILMTLVIYFIFNKPTHNVAVVTTIPHIVVVTTIQAVTDLVYGSTTKYNAGDFILVPLFLVKYINDSIVIFNGCTRKYLVRSLQWIKAFDAIHDQYDYTKKYNKITRFNLIDVFRNEKSWFHWNIPSDELHHLRPIFIIGVDFFNVFNQWSTKGL